MPKYGDDLLLLCRGLQANGAQIFWDTLYNNDNKELGIVCRGISRGGALSVAKLIEERAPPISSLIKELGKLIQPVYAVSR